MNIPYLMDAVAFAATAHHGQLRGGERTPYVNHVFDVARRISLAGFDDPDTLIAALLHDTVEDTTITLDQIRARFGPRVTGLVQDLTLPDEAQKDREKKQVFQLAKMRDMDLHGQAIKIADKTSNVYDLYADPPKWGIRAIRGYSDASREVVFAVTGGDTRLIARAGLDDRLVRLLGSFEDAYATVRAHYGWEVK